MFRCSLQSLGNLQSFVKVVVLVSVMSALAGCTEESRNKLSRQADNLLGVNLKVSYVDEGRIVKSWIVDDGKITTGKDDQGQVLGYYYFWTENASYVQVPIERTIIEEVSEETSTPSRGIR